MERQNPRLGAETEQRQQKRHAGPEFTQMTRAHGREGIVAMPALHHAKTQQNADGAEMGDQ